MEIKNEISQFEKILHSKKVRYAILDNLINPILPDIEEVGDTVNIFIDVYSVYNQLFNPETIDMFSSMNKREKNKFASDILNMAGHYRNYFGKFHSRYTNIYLYFPSRICEEKVYKMPFFKKEWYEKRLDFDNIVFGTFSKLIARNLEVTKRISEYLPHIYVIDTRAIDHLVVPELVIQKSEMEKKVNIVISNDNLSLAIPSKYEYGFMLTVKGDNSKLIDNFGIADALSTAKTIGGKENQIVKYFFDYIIALAGIKKMGIEPITGFTVLKGIKTFIKLIDNKNIELTRYDDYVAISNILVENKMISEGQAKFFELNYRTLTQSNNIIEMSKGKIEFIMNQIVDKVDAVGLKTLNQESFYRDPLNFDFLFMGEEYA